MVDDAEAEDVSLKCADQFPCCVHFNQSFVDNSVFSIHIFMNICNVKTRM